MSRPSPFGDSAEQNNVRVAFSKSIYCLLGADFTYCFVVSIVEFEQLNFGFHKSIKEDKLFAVVHAIVF